MSDFDFPELADQLGQGNGFVSPVLFRLYLQPDQLPLPYGGANGPLLSILVAGLYWVFGESLLVAQIPMFFFGSLLAPLTFILALNLDVDLPRSFGAGVLVMVNPLLVHQVLSFSTNTPHAAFALAFLVLLCGPMSVRSSILMGVAWGFAYLTRYQAVLLVVPFLLVVFSRKKIRFVHVVATGIALLLTTSPWLIRNYLVFDKFLYNYASDYFLVLGSMPGGINLVRMATPPPEQLPYLIDHFGQFVASSVYRAWVTLEALSHTLPGNVAVFLGCVIATVRCWSRWRQYLPLLGLAAAMVAFFVPTYFEPRYLMLLIPILVIQGVVGLTSWRLGFDGGHGPRLEIAAVLVVLTFGLSVNSYREFRSLANTSYLDMAASHRATGPFFSQFPPWSLTVMAFAPEYQAHFHKQFAVSLPLNLEQDLPDTVEKYEIDFIVLQDRHWEALQRLPARFTTKLGLLYEAPSVRVYGVGR